MIPFWGSQNILDNISNMCLSEWWQWAHSLKWKLVQVDVSLWFSLPAKDVGIGGSLMNWRLDVILHEAGGMSFWLDSSYVLVMTSERSPLFDVLWMNGIWSGRFCLRANGNTSKMHSEGRCNFDTTYCISSTLSGVGNLVLGCRYSFDAMGRKLVLEQTIRIWMSIVQSWKGDNSY